MNAYSKLLINELLQFKGRGIDEEIFGKFIEKISHSDKLTKDVNIDEHICAFFIPITTDRSSIYLGHHIKADSWIPPGGHIATGEHPIKTVIREFREELDYDVNEGQIEKFSLSIKDISSNPRNPCKVHYDIWYLVTVEKADFKYIRREYYDARWYSLKEAYERITVPEYKKIVGTIRPL